MEHRKFQNIIRIVLGLIFIFSGMAKAFDVNYFANIIASYGYPSLGYLAPAIIGVELLLGLLLFFGISTRWVSLISLLTVLFFTTVYSYGLLSLDINDCGCFGRISFLNSSTWFLYLRNALLIAGFIYLFLTSRNTNKPVGIPLLIASLVFVFVAAFIAGKTFRWKAHPINDGGKKEKIALADHDIKDFYNFSPDSTYMVTLFSYSCPHCLNSMGNVSQFEKFGVVDKVIGVSIDDKKRSKKFAEIFQPEFEIVNIPARTMFKITNDFPVTYFISRDTIQNVVKGEVPSAYFFIPETL